VLALAGLAGLAGKAAQHTGGCQLSAAQHHHLDWPLYQHSKQLCSGIVLIINVSLY